MTFILRRNRRNRLLVVIWLITMTNADCLCSDIEIEQSEEKFINEAIGCKADNFGSKLSEKIITDNNGASRNTRSEHSVSNHQANLSFEDLQQLFIKYRESLLRRLPKKNTEHLETSSQLPTFANRQSGSVNLFVNGNIDIKGTININTNGNGHGHGNAKGALKDQSTEYPIQPPDTIDTIEVGSDGPLDNSDAVIIPDTRPLNQLSGKSDYTRTPIPINRKRRLNSHLSELQTKLTQ